MMKCFQTLFITRHYYGGLLFLLFFKKIIASISGDLLREPCGVVSCCHHRVDMGITEKMTA